MATTLQQTINLALTYIQYSPLSAGTGGEPAISIANQIQNMILNAPFTWGWNRNSNDTQLTTPGTQDYTINVTDFSFLEKVTLIDPDGTAYEVLKVENTATLGTGDTRTAKLNRPGSVCVLAVSYGQNVTLRFLAVPDKAYKIVMTYQKLVTPFAALSDTWAIPDQYLDIYNNLFIGESMAIVDDSRAAQYRQRGVAVLLAKSEGLSEMERNSFLEQFFNNNNQQQSGSLRTQQAAQARSI